VVAYQKERSLRCQPVAKSNFSVRAVAKRLVLRRTTTAECYAIAQLVLLTLVVLQSHASAYPNRPATLLGRILDERNGWCELRFDDRTGVAIADDQPS